MNIKNYNHVTINSKNVKEGSIFVSVDSNMQYINEAIKNKASLIITKRLVDISVENIVVKNIKYFYTYLYKQINNINMNDYKIIAVTGTDGKTTTAKMIYDTITSRYDAIYIGTLGIISKDKTIKTKNTTPDIETIYETLLYAKNNKIKYIILEASSEGILDKRLLGIRLDVIIFTNLTHEHLNTHKNMNEYFNTKKKLLKLLKENGKLITNIEDKYGRILSGNKTINFGLHKGNISTSYIKLFKDKTTLIINYDNKFFYTTIPFIGIYNIYNFLACFAAINYLFNIKLFDFKTLKKIDGRFININDKIIIDFAHTPNALENLLLTIKNIYDKKIILVLGSAGEKDKTKRILLGMIADKYCDKIIITSEDPKKEPVIQIISDIAMGILNKEYYVSLFRKEAIDIMLSLLKNDSIGVIIGKGLEDTENINGILYNHSDYFYTQKKLSEINHLIPNASLANLSAKSL